VVQCSRRERSSRLDCLGETERGVARQTLQQLQQAYLFDVVESDCALAFRKRERDPVLTIGHGR
jgi:hypothetical protein